MTARDRLALQELIAEMKRRAEEAEKNNKPDAETAYNICRVRLIKLLEKAE